MTNPDLLRNFEIFGIKPIEAQPFNERQEGVATNLYRMPKVKEYYLRVHDEIGGIAFVLVHQSGREEDNIFHNTDGSGLSRAGSKQLSLDKAIERLVYQARGFHQPEEHYNTKHLISSTEDNDLNGRS